MASVPLTNKDCLVEFNGPETEAFVNRIHYLCNLFLLTVGIRYELFYACSDFGRLECHVSISQKQCRHLTHVVLVRLTHLEKSTILYYVNLVGEF